MIHNQDIAFNTIRLASDEDSFSTSSGSLVINGGIGCKKSINCNNIINECLLNKKSAFFRNDVSISKELKVNVIIPKEDIECSFLGNSNNRYNDIYSDNIDTNNLYVNNILSSDVSKSNCLHVYDVADIGKNKNFEVMFNVDGENNTITTNSDIFNIRTSCNENALQINNTSICLNSILTIKHEVIKIFDKECNIFPFASYLIIMPEINYPRIDLMLRKTRFSHEDLDNGTYIKIYNKSKDNFNIVVNNCIIINNTFLEFILIDSDWISLSNDGNPKPDFCPKIDHENINHEYNSESHDDCDSSSNFGKDNLSMAYSPDVSPKIIRKIKKNSLGNSKSSDSKEEYQKKLINSDDCKSIIDSTSFNVK